MPIIWGVALGIETVPYASRFIAEKDVVFAYRVKPACPSHILFLRSFTLFRSVQRLQVVAPPG